MNTIRILLVDDHPLLRLGVRRSLENTGDFTVTGECADLLSARHWLHEGGQADVAILDRSLPDGDGLDIAPLLKAAGMKIIVFTVEDDEDEIRAAVDAGVDGYLLKSSDSDQIAHSIGMVLQDAGAFPPQVLKKLTRNSTEESIDKLSTRELQIAEYVAEGLSNKMIGNKLGLSDNTVRNHLANIMQKLGFHNRVQVATLILQHLKKIKRI